MNKQNEKNQMMKFQQEMINRKKNIKKAEKKDDYMKYKM